MLLILQICPRLCQTIGDIYDFELSLVSKIWTLSVPRSERFTESVAQEKL